MRTIVEIAVFTPLRQTFDYLTDTKIALGARVLIPFGRRELVGIVLAQKQTSDYPLEKLKSIIKVLDNEHFVTAPILELCQFASHYYHYPLGDILAIALPKLLREAAPATITQQIYWQCTAELPGDALNRAKAQLEAYEFIQQHHVCHEQLLKLQGIKNSTLHALAEKKLITSFTVDKCPEVNANHSQPLTLNTEQALVYKTISKSLKHFSPFVLDGVTGSGKTEIYLQLIQACLDAGQQALVLVPEIGLTPQTLSRFQQRFNTMIVSLHSGLSDRERCDAWLLAKKGLAKIIIGTRSAVFTPMPELGIIIIDEEHDSSFKQQDSLRYHARDLAIVRAKHANIPIIMGSATPCLESLYNAKHGKYYYCHLSQRAGEAKDPQYHIIDTRRYKLNDAGLSKPLIEAIKQTLQQGEQVLLFINRRGYAPVMMCHQCGFIADCDYCSSHLTVHQADNNLACHHCGFHTRIPVQCPSCQQPELSTVGIGTEKIADQLEKYFPGFPILRIDRDSTRKKDALKTMLATIHQGKPCLLVGTQMIAKGHHFKKVTLVGVLNADNGLFNPDFRACERFGQLLCQVAGRAGRETLTGHVYIQTLHPDNKLLITLIEQGYLRFAEHLLTERQLTELPPYSHLALLRVQSKNQESAFHFLNKLKQHFAEQYHTLNILGPIPAAMPKRAGKFHFHLLLQSTSRQNLQRFNTVLIHYLNQHPPPQKLRWQLEMDPLETI